MKISDTQFNEIKNMNTPVILEDIKDYVSRELCKKYWKIGFDTAIEIIEMSKESELK